MTRATISFSHDDALERFFANINDEEIWCALTAIDEL